MISEFKQEAWMLLSIHTWIGLLLFVVLAQFLYNSIYWSYEHIIPAESFYVYKGVYPIKNNFAINELPRFVTDAEYTRDMNMRWQDTLYCRLQSGFIDKLSTQYWPLDGVSTELRKAGTKTLLSDETEQPSWTYSVEQIPKEAYECYLQWSAIGFSETGRKVQYTDKTEWFGVNQHHDNQR